jgi:hypothetical protein
MQLSISSDVDYVLSCDEKVLTLAGSSCIRYPFRVTTVF